MSEITIQDLHSTDAPPGQAWQCPDCKSWATLGCNAAYHVNSKKHRMPVLAPLPDALLESLKKRIPDDHFIEEFKLRVEEARVAADSVLDRLQPDDKGTPTDLRALRWDVRSEADSPEDRHTVSRYLKLLDGLRAVEEKEPRA